MNFLKDYAVPTLIVTVASLLVCLVLWSGFTPTEVSAAGGDVASEEVSEGMPDMGAITPILGFVMSGIKVSLFMGIPGLITWQVIRPRKGKEKPTKLAQA